VAKVVVLLGGEAHLLSEELEICLAFCALLSTKEFTVFIVKYVVR
jgi:hypothetical protein